MQRILLLIAVLITTIATSPATAMGGGKPIWAMAGVGAGLTAISIPLSISAKKKAKSAVSKYNSGLTSNSSAGFKELKLKFTNDGIGVVLKF